MSAARTLVSAFLTGIALWTSSPLGAEELPKAVVRAAMKDAETLLMQNGIDVTGYASTAPPQAQFVPGSHIFLQGNDGAFVSGSIYLNEDAIEDCLMINLLHELVHDATMKYALFHSVGNGQVRETIEALADQITSIAAENPYRPRCVSRRSFQISKAELVRLAAR